MANPGSCYDGDKGAVCQRVFSAEVRTHGQASLERSCQSPHVQDETVAGLVSEVVR